MRSTSLAVVLAGLALAARDAAADARLDRALAQQACEAKDPRCDWLATLSTLERASVARGLAARGYEIEPAPWGKPIGRIHIYNEDVFAEKSRVLQFFNNFHVTTQEYAIRHELVIEEGEPWDQERVDEAARRLRDPLYSSVIAIVPVKSSDPAKVDMLVVTRDIWSLRLNTQYSFQRISGLGSKLVGLSLALSENNFLGTRSVLAAALTLDQGAFATGPLFIDKNLFGQKIEFRARVDAVFSRRDFLFAPDCDAGTAAPILCATSDKFEREGSQSTIAISKPLWSLSSKWGAGASFSHRFAVNRQFRNFDIDTYDFAGTPEDDRIPRHYRIKRWGVSAYATRQLGGKRIKHQLTLGHSVDNLEVFTRGSFPSEEARAAFIEDVLPRAELTSVASASYGFFTPRYRTLRNISTFDLAEDARYGPDFDVSIGIGLEALGSDANFQRASASFGWSFPWCRDGLVRPSIGIGGRRQPGVLADSDFIDNSATGGVRVVTPTYGFARVVAQALFATRWNDAQNAFYTQGSDDGLRGYSINEFRGQRFVRGNVELRTVPRALWVLRYGGVLFYDVGSAADTFKDMRLFHDVGVGLRVLVPQTSRELFRFDLAFPLVDGIVTQAGRPQFIAGFESAF